MSDQLYRIACAAALLLAVSLIQTEDYYGYYCYNEQAMLALTACADWSIFIYEVSFQVSFFRLLDVDLSLFSCHKPPPQPTRALVPPLA